MRTNPTAVALVITALCAAPAFADDAKDDEIRRLTVENDRLSELSLIRQREVVQLRAKVEELQRDLRKLAAKTVVTKPGNPAPTPPKAVLEREMRLLEEITQLRTENAKMRRELAKREMLGTEPEDAGTEPKAGPKKPSVPRGHARPDRRSRRRVGPRSNRHRLRRPDREGRDARHLPH